LFKLAESNGTGRDIRWVPSSGLYLLHGVFVELVPREFVELILGLFIIFFFFVFGVCFLT
jgi:hypothetical protein